MLIVLIFGFIAGVIFVNVAKTGSIRPVIIAVVIGLLIGLAVASIRVVPAGYVGVVDFFGGVSPSHLNSGINLVNPLARVVNVSARTQEATEIMSIPSKEGLNVALDVTILYRLKPEAAVNIYKTVGENYQGIVLIPQFRSVARGVTVGYEAKALYTSERESLAQKFQTDLDLAVEKRGLIIEKVLLRSINLPALVSGAIEQKLKAEQDSEKMKFVLLKEQQEAERKRVEAAGIRDAQAIINASLTSQYLHYFWINTLNDNPNVIYVATEANMPLFRATTDDNLKFNRKPAAPQEK